MDAFKELGLTFYEAKALDVILRDMITPKQLAKLARIPPGKVYSVIRSLRQKGLIDETHTRPKRVHVSDPSAVVSKLIEQKQQRDDAIYASLRRSATEAQRVQSQPSRFFQLGVTVEDNKGIQLRTFTEAKHEVCQIINIHHKPQSNRESKSLWEREIGAAIGRGVRFRAIYPEGVRLPVMLERLSKNRFAVRRKDTDYVRCDIIDGKKVLLKLVHADPLCFGGVIFIEDERFARNLQKVFEQLWREAAR